MFAILKIRIELARDVMLKSDHVLLMGEGAEEFAFSLGYEYTEQDYFFTDRRYEQLQSMKEKVCLHCLKLSIRQKNSIQTTKNLARLAR